MTTEEAKIIFVSEAEAGVRLDVFLASHFPEFTRSYFQGLIEKELVLLNGNKVKKREKPQAHDEIEIQFALTDEMAVTPESIPLDILFEDEHLIIVNKPPGMVVHPAPGNWSGTFVNALLYHCSQLPDCGDPKRPGIVHRLDKDTSGLLVAAKTYQAHSKLVAAFSERQVHKEYIAVCEGMPAQRLIDEPIGRHPTNRQQMAIVPDKGKPARTHCFPLKTLGSFSLVQCLLETGRTHQIRVHLRHTGHPIVGDPIYGNLAMNKKLNLSRQLLHAHRLSFIHPISGEMIEVEAPLPQDIKKFIQPLMKTELTIPKRCMH